MASLDDLKKGYLVLNLQKITKAMKWTRKLRQARRSREETILEKMNNIILNLSKNIVDVDNSPKLLSGTGQDNVHLCVVMTSDKLCGGLTQMPKKKNYFKKIIDNGKTLKILTVGSKE